MKYILAIFILLSIGCKDKIKINNIDYGDSKYMALDTMSFDSSYIFKDSLPDGEYFAFDFDTLCALNDLTEKKNLTRRYLRSSASFLDGKKNGDWCEWMYDCFRDTLYLSQRTVYNNGFYLSYISFHPFSSDTFMVNTFPDSAINFKDWIIYTEYSKDRLYTTEIVDSDNTTLKTIDRLGKLISYSEIFNTKDSINIADFDKDGNLTNRQIFTYNPISDSTLFIEYDSTEKIIHKKMIKL
ncbi:hypothetical protein ACE01N_20255 [Saccharicrinis sp. FJH2]|uniref:hypothetical protein n=1 Tax=Saccharicrinis sp. FJH65 TaxID=3344659 RepID=UPI0035F4E6FB